MHAATVTDANGVTWTVRVRWRPRFLGLTRRIGGWRDKTRNPDQGEDVASKVLDPLGDPGTQYDDWTYTAPAGPSGANVTGARGSGSLDLPRGSHGGSGGGNGGWLDSLDDAFAVIVAAIVVFLAVIVAAAVVWWVVLPLLLLVVDGLVAAGALVLGTLARLVLRRPWTVEAVSTRGDRFAKQVVGWRNARRERDDLVHALGNGIVRVGVPGVASDPPPTLAS